MGGFFAPQQTEFQGAAPQAVSGVSPALAPFQAQLAQAIAQLFGAPGPGVTPLEQSTIEGGFAAGGPMASSLATTAAGGYLPGVDASGNPTGNGNPFTAGLLNYMNQQGDIARRNLASAAQRSGAFASTGNQGYLGQASLLESQLAGQRDQVLSQQYEQERNLQQGAPGQAVGLGQYLLGSAAIPRQVAYQSTMNPYAMGLQLLGPWAGRADVANPQTQQSFQSNPSPFASLINLGTGVASMGSGFGWWGAPKV